MIAMRKSDITKTNAVIANWTMTANFLNKRQETVRIERNYDVIAMDMCHLIVFCRFFDRVQLFLQLRGA